MPAKMSDAMAETGAYRTVTPYLKLPNCGRVVEFLKQAFGAVEKNRLTKPDGSVLHAEIAIGDTLIMVHELPPPAKPKLGAPVFAGGRRRCDVSAGDRRGRHVGI